jgi:hypothetical protein
MSTNITCPSCQAEIEITEVMSAQLRGQIRTQMEDELRPARESLQKRAAAMEAEKQSLEDERAALDEEVNKRLAAEREKLIEQARSKVASELDIELKDREEELGELKDKLANLESEELDRRKKERALRKREEALDRQRIELEEKMAARLDAERQRLIDSAKRKAAEEFTAELKDRDDQLCEANEKLAAARDAELGMRKREREMKTQAEEFELTLNRRLDEERNRVRESALKQASEEHQLRDAEKDKKVADLVKQLDDMKRKAEQGSQQAQGEVLELALEDLLRQSFPGDHIQEVPKGVSGGDVIQRVVSQVGVDCGSVLWETKRTKRWSDGWLAKLRQDQRDAKASAAIIVSTVLPDGVEHFAQIAGVWVCSWACAIHVATALRTGLLEVGKVRQALAGQHGKMETVYDYLASAEFRNRVTGIVEAFAAMKNDLDREKRAVQKQWAKREKQIEQAIGSTAGMYGDLQGIIGASLPEIEGMQLPELEVDSRLALLPDTGGV